MRYFNSEREGMRLVKILVAVLQCDVVVTLHSRRDMGHHVMITTAAGASGGMTSYPTPRINV